MCRSTRLSALLAVCACWLSTTAFARAESVTARLEPDTIAVNQAATLEITTDAGAEPDVPQIKGLDIARIGTQTSVSVTNGVRVQSATYLYSVQAQRPGDYVLAGIQAGGAGAPQLTLHVQAGGTLPPKAAQSAQWQQPTAAEDAKLAFMRLHVDAKRMYAGQSVPFTVKAFFRGGTGVTLRGRPVLSSDAFTVNGLDDEPTQQQTAIDGVPYLAVTWRGALTAAKAGDFPLDMTLPVSMQYREQAQPAVAQRPRGRSLRDLFGGGAGFGPGSAFDSLLDDPFFNSVFDEPFLQGFGSFGRTVDRDLDLHGRAGNAHVEPLPSAGRPADFTGAVGQFDLTARLAQSTLTQGEPVDLQLTLQGNGNFGQFSVPALQASADWKAYAAHSSFEAADRSGTRGELRLQQPIAALHAGHISLPALHFSYFDPDQARYVTKASAAIAVDVAPVPEAESASATPKPSTPAATSGSQAARSDEPSVWSLAKGGIPGWLLPSGLALLGLAVAVCAAIALRRSRSYQRQRQRLQGRRVLSQQLRRMRRARRMGDRLAYLRVGRQTLRRRLGTSWGVPPESITLRELDARWPGAPECLRQLLEQADEADYGRAGLASVGTSFDAWARGVDQQLAHMEVPS